MNVNVKCNLNCNFTDNNATYGGAVYFSNTGTVSNCNFVDNKATGTNSWGGAIMLVSTGEVTNCKLTHYELFFAAIH